MLEPWLPDAGTMAENPGSPHLLVVTMRGATTGLPDAGTTPTVQDSLELEPASVIAACHAMCSNRTRPHRRRQPLLFELVYVFAGTTFFCYNPTAGVFLADFVM